LISSYPNPTPQVPTENPQRGAVETDPTVAPRRGVNLPAGNEGRSSFSQLLNGELALAQSGRSVAQDKHQENAESDPSPRYQTTVTNDVSQGVATTSSESESIVKPEILDARSLSGAFSSWGGLPTMFLMGDPLGLANTAMDGMARPGGLPPEVVTSLAADIASGYSVKNGVQTLTVNLEPEHLGRVEIRLLAKGDHLSVRLMAANPEAESALRENIKDLAEAIQVRTGRYQQMEVRVELRESHDPDQDSKEKENPDFAHQDSSGKHGSDPETGKEPPDNQPNQVATEPDPWAQEG